MEGGGITLVGVASTRSALIEFKQALDGLEDFSEAKIPIESLIAETDIPFNFSLSYLPSVPKKPVKLQVR